MSDIRFAVRQLVKRPGFTAAAVATLGLGIGATTAVFALVDATLLRPFDLPAPERLVSAYTSDAENPYRSFVYSDYVDLRDRTDVFTGLAAHFATDVALAGDGPALRVPAELVSGNYFSVLGVTAAAGRLFVPADDRAGTDALVVSAGLAARRFGRPDAAVGRTVRVNDHPYTIVGVAPSAFQGIQLAHSVEVWIPMAAWDRVATGFYASFDAVEYAAQRGPRRIGLWHVTGRLRSEASLAHARDQLGTVARALAAEFPETNAERGFTLISATTAAVSPASRQESVAFLAVLAGTVLLTLIIACANVANLMLARALDRSGEIGVRMALGAGRRHITTQFLTESVLVAVLGAGVGLLVAYWGVDLLGTYRLPGGVPVAALALEVDVRLLAVASGLAVLSAAAFGTAPALLASRTPPATAIRSSSGRAATGRAPVRRALVSVQVALSLVLLVGAGLFVRSMHRALAEDFGFDPHDVLTLSVSLGESGYEPAEANRFFTVLLEQLAAVPAVQGAGITSIPFGERGIGVSSVWAFDRGEGFDAGRIALTRASTGYFAAAGTGVVAGRAFTAADDASAPRVAIVNESFARRVWPNEDPVGRRFNFSGPSGTPLTVVGVVADARHESVGQDAPLQVFLPLRQNADAAAGDAMTLYVRAAVPPAALAGPVREVLRRLDPALPVFDVMTLDQRIAGTLGTQRLGRLLLVLLGLAATSLALIGVYGVTAHAATRRTREFGIRMALGATAAVVRREVLRNTTSPLLIGLAAGAALALPAGRLAARFLYGVSPHDPLTYLLAGALLTAAALGAAWLPARRAARTDPMEALRHE